MGEDLSIDNILSAEDIDDLFTDTEDTIEEPKKELEKGAEDNNKKQEETTEVDPETLFDKPESVGSGENIIKEKEESDSNKEGTSPNNFYSSIAKALKDEDIFPDLDEDTINKANTPEDFRDLIERQIKAGLDEKQKRVYEALDYGVEPSKIKQFETTISYLDSLKDEDLSNEDDKGEDLRRKLIYQDFVNRGYSDERAKREVTKSFNAGTDIEDAKEALNSNKEFFTEKYNELINEAKAEEEKEVKQRKEQAEQLKKSILEDKKVFGELEVDKSTRQKIFDNISKPIYKDPNTGEYLTAIQKYEMEHRTDFLKNVSLIYTLTDGFKNLDGLVKSKVKRAVKSSLAELEKTISNTARTSDGNIRFTTGANDDPEAFAKGWDLDI